MKKLNLALASVLILLSLFVSVNSNTVECVKFLNSLQKLMRNDKEECTLLFI